MGERSDQIEQEIRERRKELGDNFGELEAKIKRAVDWRNQFEQRPGTMLAVAFGGGVLLSALFGPRRRHPRAYNSEIMRSDMPSHISPGAAQTNKEATVTPRGETRQNLLALGDAVLGVAVSRVTGIVDSLLPGFQQEFTRAKGSRRSSVHETSPKSTSGSSQSEWGRPS